MAYEANRDKEAEKERNDRNNANTISNAADVAIASKNPYGVAIGGAIKTAEKVTGGKSTELLGKAMTKSNRINPMGKQLQKTSNQLSESGVGDLAGKAASLKSRHPELQNSKNQIKKRNSINNGGEDENSLPSSNGKNTQIPGENSQKDKDNEDENVGKKKKKNTNKESVIEDDEEKETAGEGIIRFTGKTAIFLTIIIALPLILAIILFIIITASVTGIISTFEDAFGITNTTGEVKSNNNFKAKNDSQQNFYNRISNIKTQYESQNKKIEGLKVVATYYILKKNGAKIDYDYMTDAKIKEIADSMLSNGVYNETTFKNNLVNKIIPEYIPGLTNSQKENIAEEIFDYVDDYYSLVGGQGASDILGCKATGTCNYYISGFYIPDKGSYRQQIQVKDLYVRLMQCGIGNGHDYGGTFGKPLDGEALVPFEKYILGVTYNALGEDAPKEAIKAHMVAARSFILSRHVDLEGWRTLKHETTNRWVIQVASCTQDQVYCDPDQGCSGKDVNWSQVYSGQNHNEGFLKPALSDNSRMRELASITEGELLVNDRGYVVYTKYNQEDINKFVTLAKSGLNYKQILLQVYNEGNRNYKASDIYQATCTIDDESCFTSSGDFAYWKQYTGPWINTQLGNSNKNIRQIGCLATSISILIAKSGVPTNVTNFNPGTFVEYLSANGGFAEGGNLLWYEVSKAAPSFKYQNKIDLLGMSKEQKLNTIKQIVNQTGVYAVAEVKGNTGQHWVAIDSINGNTINMMDPGSTATDMWNEYNWANTSAIAYYMVG